MCVCGGGGGDEDQGGMLFFVRSHRDIHGQHCGKCIIVIFLI